MLARINDNLIECLGVINISEYLIGKEGTHMMQLMQSYQLRWCAH